MEAIKIGGSLMNANDLEQGYYLYRYYGFDYVELCLRHNMSPTLEIMNILKELNEIIPVRVGHLPNMTLEKANKQRNIEFIKMMGSIGTVDTLVIHWLLDDEMTEEIGTLEKIEELSQYIGVAKDYGIQMTIENTPSMIWNYEKVLMRLPDLGMTLDVGHANLYGHSYDAQDLLEDLSERVKHMHFHDNHAGASLLCDTHMPYGAGTLNFNRYIDIMEKIKYNKKITLELKCRDKSYLDISRQKLKASLENGGY